jgi:putative ATPase
MAECCLYLALAPKSNTVKTTYFAALEDVQRTRADPVPLHLRNAVTPLMRSVGYGEGYRYVHADPQAQSEMMCLPESLAGRRYLPPDQPPS